MNKIHFIAIGGAAMHNLALALEKKGYTITGSDDEIFEPSRSRLYYAGILPMEFGWFPEKLSTDIDAVILGMHAREDNPELLRAQELGLKIYSYPEFLYEQTKDKTRVVIGGSHGKTTITSMVMHVLKEHGVAFDYMVGSQIDGFETMVSLSEDTQIAIFEGDEYLSSPIDRRPKFHLYKPCIGLINGVAWDHINVFPTYDMYKEQFRIFTDLVEKNGALFYNNTDRETVDIAKCISRNDLDVEPYDPFNFEVVNGKCVLQLDSGAKVPLEIFGEHNMQNLSGAKKICNKLGITDEVFFASASTFAGSKKRLQKLFEDGSKAVFLDFAHAPSKVAATVNAVRNQYKEHELIAILELHTFSSLNKDFIGGYHKTLDLADKAFLFYNPEVVKHKRLPEISAGELQEAFSKEGLRIVTKTGTLVNEIKSIGKHKKQVYLFMSSGSFGGLETEELIGLVNN